MIDIAKAKAVVEFSADTKDLKRGIADVNRAEEDLAKKQLDRANARNAQYEKWIAGIGKATVVLGGAALAAKALWESWEFSARKAQLSSNVMTADLERLRKGFGGLRSEMQALEAANTLAQSKFKLTGSQMEMVGKAMRQLVREGHSWEEVTKKVTDAFVKLETDALKDFGYHAGNAKTEAEKFGAVLEFTTKKAGLLGDTTKTAAERQQALKTSFSDAMDKIKDSLGRLGEALSPIIEALAELVHYAARFIEIAAKIVKAGTSEATFYTAYIQGKPLPIPGRSAPAGRRGQGYSFGNDMQVQVGEGLSFDEMVVAVSAGVQDASARAGRGRSEPAMYQGSVASLLGTGSRDGTVYGSRSASLGAAAGVADPFGDPLHGIDLSQYGRFISAAQEYEQFQDARTGSVLEKLFGPVEEMDAYDVALKTLHGTFTAFTGALTAGFGAWIDGSKSVKAAFEDALKAGLKATAMEMFSEGVKHSAYALGSLAFGRLDKAALHAKAAAAHFAGAATVGTVAKALHGGSSSTGASSAAPGGGVPAYSGGTSDGGQAQHTVVVFGNDYTMDSARQRQLRAARAFEEAKQASGDGAVAYA